MQDFLRTLKAKHTAVGTLRSRQGGMTRRDPIETIHPVVRRHPVTGEEALYVNKQFTHSIVGVKREESGKTYDRNLPWLRVSFVAQSSC